MYGPWGYGFGFKHRRGWFHRSDGFGSWAWWCPWRRANKESLNAYRKWLEEEMRLVDEALKREKSEEQKV